MKLTRGMTKCGEEEKTQKLLEYERTGNEQVLKIKHLPLLKSTLVMEQNIDKSTTQ